MLSGGVAGRGRRVPVDSPVKTWLSTDQNGRRRTLRPAFFLKFLGVLDFVGLPWKSSWWRRGESNPRPRTLKQSFYRRRPEIDLGSDVPSGRASRTQTVLVLTLDSTDNIERQPGGVSPASGLPGVGQREAGLKRPGRSRNRWRLSCFRVFNEASRNLGLQPCRRYPRRNQCAPRDVPSTHIRTPGPAASTNSVKKARNLDLSRIFDPDQRQGGLHEPANRF